MQTIAERAAMLGIYLAPAAAAEVRVGSLVRDASGGDTFTVDDTYLAPGPARPMDWSGELLEAVRRTVVNLMLGNGDAHLKNWSLIYRAGGVALTPAYDIVPTFLYGDPTLALPFGGTRNAARITLRRFERAGGLVKVSPDLLANEAKRTVEIILDVWPRKMAELPLPPGMREGILARWKTLALVDQVRGRRNDG